MKMRSFLFILLNAVATVGYTQNKLNDHEKQVIATLINTIKTNNKEKIANLVIYPLQREYPLADIRNKQEFVRRFDQIFDQKLTAMIAHSRPDDWSPAGWQGIMLDNGNIWIDEDGKITSINYQSANEKDMLKKALEKDKESLPVSMRQFVQPLYLIKTPTYKIRIDEIKQGNYRYASWKIDDEKKMPDLILEHGVRKPDGNGGNNIITFRDGDQVYQVAINLLRENDEPEVYLTVYENEKKITAQGGRIIRN